MLGTRWIRLALAVLLISAVDPSARAGPTANVAYDVDAEAPAATVTVVVAVDEATRVERTVSTGG